MDYTIMTLIWSWCTDKTCPIFPSRSVRGLKFTIIIYVVLSIVLDSKIYRLRVIYFYPVPYFLSKSIIPLQVFPWKRHFANWSLFFYNSTDLLPVVPLLHCHRLRNAMMNFFGGSFSRCLFLFVFTIHGIIPLTLGYLRNIRGSQLFLLK